MEYLTPSLAVFACVFAIFAVFVMRRRLTEEVYQEALRRRALEYDFKVWKEDDFGALKAELNRTQSDFLEERKLQLDLAGGGVWKTASGHVIRVRDMSTNHIQNTLRMFRDRQTVQPFASMKKELARREEDQVWIERTKAKEIKASVDVDVLESKELAKHRIQTLVEEASRNSHMRLITALRELGVM